MGNSQQRCSKSPYVNVIGSIDKNAKNLKHIKKSVTTNSLATSNRTNLNEKISLDFSGSSEFSKKYSKIPAAPKSISCFSFTNSNSSLNRNDLVGITPSNSRHINISESLSKPSNGFLKKIRQRIGSKRGHNSKMPTSVTESAIADIKRTNYVSLQEIRSEENEIEIEVETKRIDVRRSPGIYDLSEFAKNVTLKELYEYEDKLESDYKEKSSDSECSASDSCFEELSMSERSSKSSSSSSSESSVECEASKSFTNCLITNKENANYRKKFVIPKKLDECDEEEGAAILSSDEANRFMSEDFSFIDEGQCETARSSGSYTSSHRSSINQLKLADVSESAYQSESLSQSFFKHQNFFHQHFSSNTLNASTPLKFLNEVNKKLISYANSKNHVFEQFDDSRDNSIIRRKDENFSDSVSLFTNQIAPLAASETTTLSNSNDNIDYQFANNKRSINLFKSKSESERNNNHLEILT